MRHRPFGIEEEAEEAEGALAERKEEKRSAGEPERLGAGPGREQGAGRRGA